MRRSGQWSRDKHRIRVGNTQESAYYSAGIPSRYWHEEWNLTPTGLSYPRLGVDQGNHPPIGTDLQKQAMDDLLKPETFNTSWRVGIGSDPNGDKAMAFACRVAKKAVDLGKKIHFIDAGSPRWMHEVEDNEELVVIYNLSPEASTEERLMVVRDILIRVSDRLCILVVDGNPGVYFNMLKFYKNALIYFTGPTVVTKSI